MRVIGLAPQSGGLKRKWGAASAALRGHGLVIAKNSSAVIASRRRSNPEVAAL